MPSPGPTTHRDPHVIESRTARRERTLGTCTAPFAERTAGGRAVKSASATVTDGSATSHADVIRERTPALTKQRARVLRRRARSLWTTRRRATPVVGRQALHRHQNAGWATVRTVTRLAPCANLDSRRATGRAVESAS